MSAQNVGAGESPKAQIVLVISGTDRVSTLLTGLRPLNAAVRTLKNCREARRWLRDHPDVDVIITDVSLSDGNWCDLLRYLVDSGVTASVVVTSSTADEALWSEVLWRGAYDLLVEPYEDFEVRRIVDGAVRAARSSQETGLRQLARSSAQN